MAEEIVTQNLSRNEEALELCEEVLTEIELSENDFLSTLRKSGRIFRLINDIDSIKFISTKLQELSNYQSGVKNNEEKINEIKILLETRNDVNASKGVTLNWNFRNEKSDLERQIEDLKSAIYSLITRTFYELKFSKLPQSIFEKSQNKVDVELGKIAPESIKKFISAYERLSSGNEEDWSQALMTCRRILTDFADAVYPPMTEKVTDSKGREREVGQNEFKNRLWMFIDENVKSEKNQKLLQHQLEFLGKRIDDLYDLSNKGVHDKVTRKEVDMAVIYTYLLLGDLIQLR